MEEQTQSVQLGPLSFAEVKVRRMATLDLYVIYAKFISYKSDGDVRYVWSALSDVVGDDDSALREAISRAAKLAPTLYGKGTYMVQYKHGDEWVTFHLGVPKDKKKRRR